MKDKKMEFAFFTIPQYEKEEKWLREQHKKGWKLVSFTAPFFYHFEKCEPEDVIYRLDYNQDGLQNKAEYTQMFKDCGWEYLIDVMGYSYFRKSVKDMKEGEEEGIFSDAESKLDMAKRVMKGRVTPLIVIFFCIIIPQLLQQWNLGESISRSLFMVFAALFVVYVVLFASFAWQYFKLKKRVENGK